MKQKHEPILLFKQITVLLLPIAIELVLEMYDKGGFKKDKNVLKLKRLSEKGQLENWIRDQLEK